MVATLLEGSSKITTNVNNVNLRIFVKKAKKDEDGWNYFFCADDIADIINDTKRDFLANIYDNGNYDEVADTESGTIILLLPLNRLLIYLSKIDNDVSAKFRSNLQCLIKNINCIMDTIKY